MILRSGALPAIALAMVTWSRAPAAQTPTPATLRQIDSLIERTLAAKRIAGASLAIVANGSVVHQQGYGFADRANGLRVDPEKTLFGLSSISKVFTTIAVLQQSESGRVDLNRPAAEYVNVPNLRRDIRIADLLTHTAGFDDRTIGISARRASDVIPLSVYLSHDLPRVVRPPSTVASYSNHSFALAGLVVERAASKPFAEYMSQRVLIPLGMSRSGFAQPLPQTLEVARAIPYRPDGCLVPRIFFNDPPASAMYSTAGDMGRFLSAFLGGDGISGVLRSTAPMRDRQFSHHPALNGLTYGMRERHDGSTHSIEQGGDWDDYSSDLIISPGTKIGLFVAFSGDAAAAVADSVWKLLVAEMKIDPSPTKASMRTASHSMSPPPEGVFRLNRYSRNTLARLGVLTGAIRELRVEGDSLLGRKLYAEGDNLYRLGPDGQLIAFRVDRGTATHLFFDSAPYVAYERVKWFERRELHLAAFMLTTVILISILWRAMVRWPVNPSPMKPMRVWRKAMAVAASAAVVLLVGVGITMATIDTSELQYGLPLRLQLLLLIGAATIPAAAVAACSTIFLWLAPGASAGERWWSTIGSLGAGIFAALVLHWRLVPAF